MFLFSLGGLYLSHLPFPLGGQWGPACLSLAVCLTLSLTQLSLPWAKGREAPWDLSRGGDLARSRGTLDTWPVLYPIFPGCRAWRPSLGLPQGGDMQETQSLTPPPGRSPSSYRALGSSSPLTPLTLPQSFLPLPAPTLPEETRERCSSYWHFFFFFGTIKRSTVRPSLCPSLE